MPAWLYASKGSWSLAMSSRSKSRKVKKKNANKKGKQKNANGRATTKLFSISDRLKKLPLVDEEWCLSFTLYSTAAFTTLGCNTGPYSYSPHYGCGIMNSFQFFQRPTARVLAISLQQGMMMPGFNAQQAIMDHQAGLPPRFPDKGFSRRPRFILFAHRCKDFYPQLQKELAEIGVQTALENAEDAKATAAEHGTEWLGRNFICCGPSCPNRNVSIDKLKRCSRCRCAMYCSSQCQRAHWAEHKADCKPLHQAQAEWNTIFGKAERSLKGIIPKAP